MTTTYYKAVRPDGTSFHDPAFRWVPESGPVAGVVVTHPAPHNEDPSGWLSVATVPTDCTGMRWPCRLLAVAPVEGHPVTAPLDNLPHKRAASAWHVVGELPATDALGPQGVEVAAIIERASRLTPDEIARLRDAEWDAAREAAWVAGRDAARDAGRVAAWEAAWDAATHAARDAAWVAGRDAAWDAARDAAWDAARGAARATLTRDLITTEQYDTLMAPWRLVISHSEVPADE